MKHYDYMTGYKATDKDMQCHGDGSVNFQFEIGKWYKHEGEIELCKKGFHFCKYQSGPWAYYTDSGTRIFKVEAKGVVEEYIPGADLKFVCREIRLTEEIKRTGDCNAGNGNAGNGNTGNRNAGNGNTGNRNAGNGNTGNGNTGDCNTGDGNTGFFCQREPLVISFDKQTKLTRQEFFKQYPEIYKLGELLFQDREFDYTQFKRIPGWTLKKCKELHRKHIEGRTQAHK